MGYREPSWYVLTAGPSAGKTSTMRELAYRGYNTEPEAARLYIDQQISEGREESDVHTDPEFQDSIISIDRNMESRLMNEYNYFLDHDPEEDGEYYKVFLDRSLGDNIAYCRYFEDYEPYGIIEEARDRYGAVFLLEQIDYQKDYARRENLSEAEEIHLAIKEGYEDAGYDVIDVPLMPIDERVDFILEKVREIEGESLNKEESVPVHKSVMAA